MILLADNKIILMPDDAFPSLPKCTYLQLSSNGLTTFPNLKNFTALVKLELEGNNLVLIPNLTYLPSTLTYLYLQ